mgnify:CR=1 FL=1
MIEKIGTNAGKVWTLLDEAGTQNVKDLTKIFMLLLAG